MNDAETPEFKGRGGEGRSGGGEGRGGERGERGERKGGGKGGFFRRRKTCKLCSEKVDYVDYKNTKLLLAFIPERAKILPRRMFGTCAPCQRKVRTAILRARQMALIPYSTE
ncbi:MAG: 30S ribosomal protein S18 [Vicinamibacteria bacterium]|nr:30S ribosomal protein S18 [Vicinamibacteria bacterium]